MRREYCGKIIRDAVEREDTLNSINGLSIEQLDEMCRENKMKVIPISKRVVEYGIAREFKLIEK